MNYPGTRVAGSLGAFVALALSLGALGFVATGRGDEGVNLVKEYPCPEGEQHREPVVLPGCQKILSGGGDLLFWDLETTRVLWQRSDRDLDVTSVAVSGRANLGATGDEAKAVRLWDLETGKDVGRLLGHEAAVSALAFSADGKLLFSGSRDGSVRVWNLETKELVKSLRQQGMVLALAVSPDRRYVASAGRTSGSGPGGEAITVWKVGTWEEAGQMKGHSKLVRSLAFSPDGKSLISGGLDGTIRLWDMEGFAARWQVMAHRFGVFGVVFSPDGTRVASGGIGRHLDERDHPARLWEAKTGLELAAWEARALVAIPLSFTPDGGHLLTCSVDGVGGIPKIRLWRLHSRPTGPATHPTSSARSE